jgi:hypothetical protein
MLFLIVWVIIAAVVAMAGDGRKIGYWGAFWVSVLLSPLIGLIVALFSDRVENVNGQQTQTGKTGGPDRVEQLERLAKLKADGALTAEEYELEKRRILGDTNAPSTSASTPPPGPFSGGTVSEISMR